MRHRPGELMLTSLPTLRPLACSHFSAGSVARGSIESLTTMGQALGTITCESSPLIPSTTLPDRYYYPQFVTSIYKGSNSPKVTQLVSG